MVNSRWIKKNYKDFERGDIVCCADDQSFLRLVLKVENDKIWMIGFIHCALTENNDTHPTFYYSFESEPEVEELESLVCLGNLNDYSNFLDAIQSELHL